MARNSMSASGGYSKTKPTVNLSTMWKTIEPVTIPYTCKQYQLAPVIYGNMIHVVFCEDRITRIRNSPVRETISSYNMVNSQWSISKEPITKYTSKQCVYSIFCYLEKITLLGGEQEKAKPSGSKRNVALYYLEHKANTVTWEKIPKSDYSLDSKTINPNNCIATQHEDKKMIVISLSDQSPNINFHVFDGIDSWKPTTLHLSQSDDRYASNIILQLQSCAVLNNNLYYSLKYGDVIKIYKIDTIKMDLNNIILVLDSNVFCLYLVKIFLLFVCMEKIV